MNILRVRFTSARMGAAASLGSRTTLRRAADGCGSARRAVRNTAPPASPRTRKRRLLRTAPAS